MFNSKNGQSADKTVCCNEMAWLAGMIDADGTITVCKTDGKRNRFRKLTPRVALTTTCIISMEYVDSLLKKYNVGHYIEHRKPSFNKHAESWNIVVAGYKRVSSVLPFIIPYLITKKREALWMDELIKIRLSLPHHNLNANVNKTSIDGNNKSNKIPHGRLPYTDKEVWLFSAIKGVKTNRNLRDYTPEAIVNIAKI